MWVAWGFCDEWSGVGDILLRNRCQQTYSIADAAGTKNKSPIALSIKFVQELWSRR
jgi:hypothetical protein